MNVNPLSTINQLDGAPLLETQSEEINKVRLAKDAAPDDGRRTGRGPRDYGAGAHFRFQIPTGMKGRREWRKRAQ